MNVGQITPARVLTLAAWMDEHGLASDLLDEKYRAPGVIAENQSHIREICVNFLANLTRDEAYHGLQKRGSNTGAIRSPNEVMQDPRPEDRAFWTDVEYPELGKTFRHAGSAAVENELVQVEHKGARDRLNLPVKLNRKLAEIVAVVASADFAPPKQAGEVFQDVSTSIEVQLKLLEDVVENDVFRFISLVEELGIPAIIPSAAPPAGS